MPVASGPCPSCGAPIEFSVGASVCKVCEYCKATVHRTDRGLEDLGKVAAIANVPSLVAVGDEGTLGGRAVQVLGRVQLGNPEGGVGPWDEYYVAFDHGAAWGWLAYAEGVWYATSVAPEPPVTPAFESLHLENDVGLGALGTYRVAEVKTARILSAEGELPGRFPPGFVRHYADVFAPGRAFATIDYGDRTGPVEVFVGQSFDESDLHVTQLGPRSVEKVELAQFKCPNCGGDVPRHSGERAERIGCPYCGAVSDILAREVVAKQDAAREESPIPLGSRGTLDGVDYVVIAFLVRSANFDGERFAWSELLLFSEGRGFRWLVRDEDGWLFVEPTNLAELDLGGMPGTVRFQGKRYGLRNRSVARVDFVLGEVYWKCEVGESVRASDYVLGGTVLSREETGNEVRWSRSTPVPFPILARAFGMERGGGKREGTLPKDGTAAPALFGGANVVALIIVGVVILVVLSQVFDGGGGGSSGGPVYGGSGYYYGGK
jgi:DNA-directed RNA polymerase subunit RPC12/RpoP